MALGGLLFGVAGALIGGRIGGATGAQIGFIAGSLAGTALFPDKIKGPRLEDLKVTTSAYGGVQAIIYGTGRKAGNVFWSQDIEEVKKSRRQGLFGPKVREYRYFLTFAVDFCAGEMDRVLRIWAAGEVIYDARQGFETNKLKGLKFTFYPGSETQEVDPIIEADVGVGMTPAYRGNCYMVFDRFPLAEYNNAMPDIQVEIAQTVEEVTPGTSVDLATPRPGGVLQTANNLFFAVDWDRQFAYAIDTSPFGDPSLTGIRRVNLQTMLEDRQRISSDALAQLDLENFVADDVCPRQCGCVMPISGNLFIQLETTIGTNSEPFAVIDGSNLREIGRAGISSNVLIFDRETDEFGVATGAAPVVVQGELGPQEYVIIKSDNGSIAVFMGSPVPFCVWSTDSDETITIDSVRAVCGNKTGIGRGYGFATIGNSYTLASSDPLKLYKIRIPYLPQRSLMDELLGLAGANYFSALTGARASAILIIKTILWNYIDDQLKFDEVASFDPGDLIPGETQLVTAGRGLVYDEENDQVIFHVKADSGAQQNYWVAVDVNTGDINWRVAVSASEPSTQWTGAASRVQNDTFGFLDNNGDGQLIDTVNGVLLVNDVNFPGGVATGALGAYDSRTDSWVGLTGEDASVWARWWFRRVNPAPITVAEIVTDICERVGLEAADIDVTDLEDDEILGYIIASQNSARDAITPLSLAYFFDGVESDHKLKFPQRGAAVARTIATEDMLRDNEGDIVTEARTQEIELPSRLAVSYMDYARDYEVGTQSARRILGPTAAASTEEKVEIQVPIVANATFAKQLAEKQLYTSHIEQLSYGQSLPWTHLDLDPTDVVAIETETETIDRVRLTSIDVSEHFVMETGAMREEDGQYESFVEADAGAFPEAPAGATLCKLILLDCPLLADVDEQSGREGMPLYFKMGGYGAAGWTSATLYKSDTGGVADYEVAGRETEEMVWGGTVNALGDPATPHATDEDNELTVEFQAGDTSVIVSVTQAQMLSGANRAAVIKLNGEIEIIHFRDVTENADGTFTLSGLLRGRRGTDTMCFDHLAGEIFVLLPDDDDDQVFVDYVPLALSELGITRFFRGVGDRQFFEDAETLSVKSKGRALMPYAPVNIGAEMDGSDVVFDWMRRDRVAGDIDLDDLGGDILLSEDNEIYEIDILDGPGGDILRTVIEIDEPEYTYTAADQAEDGLDTAEQITIKVYQVSSQVGRGFSREVTLDIPR